VPHTAGKNWTRKTTVPQPFNFSSSSKSIKSINAPVTKKDVENKGKDNAVNETRNRFAAPPVAVLEYGDDGEALYDGGVSQGPMSGDVEVEESPRNSRVEARLKKFLSKYGSNESRMDEEEVCYDTLL